MSNRITKGKALIGTLAVKSTATINGVDVTPATSGRAMKVATKTITGAALHAAVQSWANPESGAIVITRIVYDVTTKSTGASTTDIGTTATSATTASDNLIDGLDTGTATICADNFDNKGTNGKALQKLATGKWVTFKEASGDVTGLVATAYIHYFVV